MLRISIDYLFAHSCSSYTSFYLTQPEQRNESYCNRRPARAKPRQRVFVLNERLCAHVVVVDALSLAIFTLEPALSVRSRSARRYTPGDGIVSKSRTPEPGLVLISLAATVALSLLPRASAVARDVICVSVRVPSPRTKGGSCSSSGISSSRPRLSDPADTGAGIAMTASVRAISSNAKANDS